MGCIGYWLRVLLDARSQNSMAISLPSSLSSLEKFQQKSKAMQKENELLGVREIRKLLEKHGLHQVQRFLEQEAKALREGNGRLKGKVRELNDKAPSTCKTLEARHLIVRKSNTLRKENEQLEDGCDFLKRGTQKEVEENPTILRERINWLEQDARKLRIEKDWLEDDIRQLRIDLKVKDIELKATEKNSELEDGTRQFGKELSTKDVEVIEKVATAVRAKKTEFETLKKIYSAKFKVSEQEASQVRGENSELKKELGGLKRELQAVKDSRDLLQAELLKQSVMGKQQEVMSQRLQHDVERQKEALATIIHENTVLKDLLDCVKQQVHYYRAAMGEYNADQCRSSAEYNQSNQVSISKFQRSTDAQDTKMSLLAKVATEDTNCANPQVMITPNHCYHSALKKNFCDNKNVPVVNQKPFAAHNKRDAAIAALAMTPAASHQKRSKFQCV